MYSARFFEDKIVAKYGIYVLILLFNLSFQSLSAQMLVDFESSESIPEMTAEGETAVVENPDKTGINTSDSVGYYKKIAGNWHYVTLHYPDTFQIRYNNTLTFKLHASTEGRIFAKFWIGDTILTEDWAPDWNFKPTPNTWVECTMDLSGGMGKEFTQLQLAACVDNNAEADVYFDDIELSNPDIEEGPPIVLFTVSENKITKDDTVWFDASESFDYYGEITDYKWDFGDGTTDSGVFVSHAYTKAENVTVVLTLRDNNNETSKDSTIIFVFEDGEKTSQPYWVTPFPETNEKIEALFQIREDYDNVYDPDEVTVDALITMPDEEEIVIPCFYYIKGNLLNNNWIVDESYQGWMLRFSAATPGPYSIAFSVTDSAGSYTTQADTIIVSAGISKGIIRNDTLNHQYYRHQTGEPFFPMGINIGWNDFDNYTTIINNLSNGNANLYRYWHTPFARQALEWSKNGFYDGLGRYSQEAATMTDALINLSEATDMYMQLVIFQHGMFSENVDPMWETNPYNITNGGYIDRAEKYFYNEACKKQTKKLLRYIVARWAYSKNIFAWEFFNEVQFTGIHNSQTALWFPGVLSWHSEMSQYIQSIDPYDHIMTTSAEHHQIPVFDSITALDNIQYHLYHDDLLSQQEELDYQFLDELDNLSIINGEYGTNNEAETPFNMQRHAIWKSIFTQVPHFMWIWGHYEQTAWANLFSMPADYINDEDFAKEDHLTAYNYTYNHSLSTIQTLGLTNDTNFYGYVYDSENTDDISGVTLKLRNIPYANYTITYYLPVSGDTIVIDSIPLITLTNKLELPTFSKALAFKIKYLSSYNLPIAIAGNDTMAAPGTVLSFSGEQSLSPEPGAVLSYAWTIVEKPAGSSLTIDNPNEMKINIIPDVTGIYKISLIVNDGFNESKPDVITIRVSSPPVAVAGNDTTVNIDVMYFYLNGSSSYDAEGDSLSYLWTLVEFPADSKGKLLYTTLYNAVLQIDATGVYKVVLIVNDGVSDSKPDTIVIHSVVTTDIENHNPSNIKVYPNPTQGEFYIESEIPIISVELYDMLGRKLAFLEIPNEHTWRVDITDITANHRLINIKINSTKSFLVKEVLVQNR